MHGVIFGCLIYFWLWRHVGHSVWRESERKEEEEEVGELIPEAWSCGGAGGGGSGKEAQHSREE